MNNEIYIKINGLNLTRIIDKLIENKVFVNNLIIKQKYVKFSIKKTDFCVFDKICRCEHKNYEIYYNSFLLRCFNKLKYLFGFFGGLNYLMRTFIFSKRLKITWKRVFLK